MQKTRRLLHAPIFWAPSTSRIPINSLYVCPDFISENEESVIINYITPLFSRKPYQESHFDSVISKYREKELSLGAAPPELSVVWSRMVSVITERFAENFQMLPPHAIDLAQEGHIGAHVDSIKFSGKIVASLSLASSRILRLTPDLSQADFTNKDVERMGLPSVVETVLNPRTFYILSDVFRYKYNHEILGPNDTPVLVSELERPEKLMRRFSIMARDVLHPSIKL